MLIIAYLNFSSFSYIITSCWSMYTATFPLSHLLELNGGQCIPQLFHFLLCYNFLLINAYRTFFFFSFVITSCWWMHTATFQLSPLLSLNANQYTLQLFHFLLCYNFMFIIAYLNFSTFSSVITCCWSMYTATFPLSPLLYLHAKRCLQLHFHFFLCYNFMLINAYRNFSTFFFVIT